MDEFLLNEEDILQHVDEYTLYCHYLGFTPDIHMKYNSPIRLDDNDPSFGIFPSRYIAGREYLWKDQAKGLHGDIFKLVRLILEMRWGSCSRYKALAHIKAEFGLGPALSDSPPVVIQRYVPVPQSPMLIKVKSKPMDAADLRFWKQFNIDQVLLDMYNVRSISCYWTYAEQSIPRFPKVLGYSYYIGGKYKLYFPLDKKEFKFRNDMTQEQLEGFDQLKYDQELLVITKSLKDVMTLRSFGYEAVAPRGESILVPSEFLRFFEGKYKRIVLLFDNDGKHRAEEYSYQKVWIPKESGEKDLSDFCKHYGPQASQELLKQLLCPR